MNPDIKEQWTGALRSGHYKQGMHRLSDGDSYCCLGVLCELATEAGIVDKDTSDEFGPIYRSTSNSGDWDRNLLPNAVMEWAELDSPRPQVPWKVSGKIHNFGLDFLNDTGTKFDEIANLIEVNL